MNRLRNVLCVFVWILVPGLTTAQQPGSPNNVRVKIPPRPASPQMNEDIEVMRRLLMRTIHTQQMSWCTACHGPMTVSQGLAFSPDGRLLASGSGMGRLWDAQTGKQLNRFSGGDKSEEPVHLWDAQTGKQLNPHPHFVSVLPVIEGVYLKGYGVVFTLTLPPQPLVGSGMMPSSPAKPVSDWDRTRQQVRGDKPAGKGGATPAKQPRLDEVLLKLLAENGHHFSQLAEGEKLTIAITFRRNDKAAGALRRGAFSLAPPQPLSHREAISAYYKLTGHTEAGKFVLGYTAPPGKKAPSSARDLELLGDMLLKQAKIKEAIDSYRRALDLGPDQRKRNELYRKLAQAALKGLGDSSDDAQRKAVERALDFIQKQLQTTDSAAAKESAGSEAMPYAQLVISAPKTLLDQVGSGRLSFGDFRHRASVEFRGIATGAKTP
jgi:hypothetical protein